LFCTATMARSAPPSCAITKAGMPPIMIGISPETRGAMELAPPPVYCSSASRPWRRKIPASRMVWMLAFWGESDASPITNRVGVGAAAGAAAAPAAVAAAVAAGWRSPAWVPVPGAAQLPSARAPASAASDQPSQPGRAMSRPPLLSLRRRQEAQVDHVARVERRRRVARAEDVLDHGAQPLEGRPAVDRQSS